MFFHNGFGMFGILFTLMFLLVFGMFIFIFVKNIAEWSKNNNSPRLSVPAHVVAKRSHTSHHNNHHSHSYYATFQFESGDRLELHLSGSEFGLLAEGDSGILTFQGTRYIEFQRNY